MCSGFGALALHVHVIFHCTKKEADTKPKYLTQSYTNYQELELEWNPGSLAALKTLDKVAAHAHNATAYVCLTFGEKDPE